MPSSTKPDSRKPDPATGPPSAAQTAKAALRRLALAQQEPTPENYARAFAEEAGQGGAAAVNPKARPVFERLVSRLLDDPAARDELVNALVQGEWEDARRLSEKVGEQQAAQSAAWALTVERLARGLERGGRQWTAARKKDSLQRVLDGNRSDFQRLQQRLRQLVASWDDDQVDDTVDVDAQPEAEAAAAAERPAAPDRSAARKTSADPDLAAALAAWPPLVDDFSATLRSALPEGDARADALATELRELTAGLLKDGVTQALAAQAADLCERARRLLEHRHHLVDQLHKLTVELTAGLVELSEDDSWAHGQCESLRERLGDTPSVRSVRAATQMLAHTREHQRQVRVERDQARVALKDLIRNMLAELGELGETTGRFSDSVQRYVQTVESADSLESLAGVVREMVEESRAVHAIVSQTQARLREGHDRAAGLEERVQTLEGELKRLSDEVSTDLLTEIANRRGLMQAFDVEMARQERQGGTLAVGLLDIDNFKKLNDSLGHAAGDQALKSLAAHVKKQLRPVDTVARFGGEEFVVLLPGTPVDESQATLTRLQRTLTSSLFMLDGREVFVTFSAGVTAWRPGERLEAALERADEALYLAKRTGKNRTCIG